MLGTFLRAALAAATLAFTIPALAELPSGPENEVQRAFAAASAARIEGPKAIALGDQAVLNLPDGFAFVPKKEAAALMFAMGNQTGDGFYGLVFSERLDGFVSVDFDRSGYVKDDDAKDWDAGELLQDLKDGTEEANKDRRQRGIPEFVVAGWVEKPAYEASTHRLVWSAELRDKTPAPQGEDQPGVNYNTYQLGREGYISMNLVTDLAHVEAEKPLARQLLAALEFNEGKRYADFNPDTDDVAAYGLAALVGGVAAKKLGLLAMVGVFFAKFGKLALLAVAGAGVALRKFFTGKKNESA